VILYGITFFFQNFGPNATTYIIPSLIYPSAERATCHGISSAFGKLGALVGAFIFMYLVNSFCFRDNCNDNHHSTTATTSQQQQQINAGLQLTFGFCALLAMIGGIWSFYFLKEEDIQLLSSTSSISSASELPMTVTHQNQKNHSDYRLVDMSNVSSTHGLLKEGNAGMDEEEQAVEHLKEVDNIKPEEMIKSYSSKVSTSLTVNNDRSLEISPNTKSVQESRQLSLDRSPLVSQKKSMKSVDIRKKSNILSLQDDDDDEHDENSDNDISSLIRISTQLNMNISNQQRQNHQKQNDHQLGATQKNPIHASAAAATTTTAGRKIKKKKEKKPTKFDSDYDDIQL
jgi:hypothetical protein